MKTIFSKVPAIIAMLIALPSFFFYVQALFEPISDIWIGSVIVAFLSVPFYSIDAIISLVKAIKKNDSKFNYTLAIAIFAMIPMLIVFGGDGKELFNAIWNIYYLLVFVLEAISIKKAFAAAKAAKNAPKA